MKFLRERVGDYDVNHFVDELVEAATLLGKLDAKMAGCKFGGVLLPMLYRRESVASLSIEGTQTTVTEMLEEEIKDTPSDAREFREYANYWAALRKGGARLQIEAFSNDFVEDLQKTMLDGLSSVDKDAIGRYKEHRNYIVNFAKKVVYEPPSPQETRKFMTELVDYMNDGTDGVNPLIKAAVAHAQFESIHPFEDGNGRVGRALTGLYMYKTGLVRLPYFHLSEAISEDKLTYYAALTSSRGDSLDSWISFFLKKTAAQAHKQIRYVDSMERLYEKTKASVREVVNSPKYEAVIEALFSCPYLTSAVLSKRLGVTVGQAHRYLSALEKQRILLGTDMKRNRRYLFAAMLDLL